MKFLKVSSFADKTDYIIRKSLVRSVTREGLVVKIYTDGVEYIIKSGSLELADKVLKDIYLMLQESE